MYRDTADTILMGFRYTMGDFYQQVLLSSLGEWSGIFDDIIVFEESSSKIAFKKKPKDFEASIKYIH